VLQTIGRRFDYPRVWQHALLKRGVIPGRVRRALRDADIVLSDMPWCPPIPGPWSIKPWFMVSHNLEYRLLEQAKGWHRRAAAWMHANESSAPRQFRDIFACADEDRDFFLSCDPTRQLKVQILRGGVDPNAYLAPPGARDRIRSQLGLT